MKKIVTLLLVLTAFSMAEKLNCHTQLWDNDVDNSEMVSFVCSEIVASGDTIDVQYNFFKGTDPGSVCGRVVLWDDGTTSSWIRFRTDDKYYEQIEERDAYNMVTSRTPVDSSNVIPCWYTYKEIKSTIENNNKKGR